MTGMGDGSPTPTHPFARRYELGAVLGRGGMADVYQATDRLLGRDVAIKIFRIGDRAPNEALRIEAEMRTLASLSHPGLVTLFDAGTSPDGLGTDTPFLVMELVDGPTLGELHAGHDLTQRTVARIGYDIADALSYIHGLGVVHRDIKPANVLMARTSTGGFATKLADFGIARVVDSNRLTEHGTTVGTAHYLSPEQATGNATGPAADIYSLGLVLIECLSGRMAFEGSAIGAALARLHRDPSIPPDLGADWVSLLTDMTSRLPQNRPTADVVAHRLRRIADAPERFDTVALPLEPSPPATVVEPLPRHNSWWIAGITGTVAIVVAAVVAWAAFGSHDSAVTEPTAIPTSDAPSPTVVEAPAQTASPIPAPPAPVAEPSPVSVSAPTAPTAAPPASVPTVGNNGNGNGNGRGNGR